MPTRSNCLTLLACFALGGSSCSAQANAERVTPTGIALQDTVFAGDWGHDGRLLSPPDSTAQSIKFLPDRTGGFFRWTLDGVGPSDFHLTRFGPDGRISPGWTDAGSTLCDSSIVDAPEVIADGSGGAHVFWLDTRSGGSRLYLQHILADGQMDPAWPECGRMVPVATSVGVAPEGYIAGISPGNYAASPDSGGFCLGWYGASDSGRTQLRVTKLDHDGALQGTWPDTGVTVTQLSPITLSSSAYAGCNWVAPGGSGEVLIQFDAVTGCYGHGCVFATLHHLARANATGVVGSANVDVNMTVREAFPDGRGGAFSLFYWDADHVLDHYWAPIPIEIDRPDITDIASDGQDGVLMLNSSTIVRYDYDGVANPGWGGTSGRVLPSLGWRAYRQGIASDGHGGLFIAWQDFRRDPSGTSGAELYATAIQADGNVAPGWLLSGLPVLTNGPFFSLRDFFPLSPGRVFMSWLKCDANDCSSPIHGQALSLDQPVAALASLVRANAYLDRVDLVWSVNRDAGATLTLERRQAAGDWTLLATLAPDGTGEVTYVDRAVQPGVSYEYRLVAGEQTLASERVTIPSAPALRLLSVASVAGALQIRLTLPSAAPARLEAFDVQGRLLLKRDLGALAAGEHTIQAEGLAGSHGLVLLRLSQAGRTVTARQVALH